MAMTDANPDDREPRVTSVVDGDVTVTGDPDGVLGALLGALLAEPHEARLRALVRGGLESFGFRGIQIQRSASAFDPAPAGAPTWSVSAHGATTTVRGELIERLFDQAYEHRRAAATASFPIGARLGRFAITEILRGTPDRGMFRAREPGSPVTYLATLGPPQDRTPPELTSALALAVPGIAPLAFVGPLEPASEAGYHGLVEVEPAGIPASQLPLPLSLPAALALALGVARIASTAHAAGLALGGLRPELVYVESAASPVLTAIAPRAERFWVTAQPRCYGVPPCFSHFFQAPELLARPREVTAPADAFSIAAMLALWLTGEHPFAGEGAAQAIAIATGRRQPWRAPAALAPLAAILNAALATDPAARLPLAALIDALADR